MAQSVSVIRRFVSAVVLCLIAAPETPSAQMALNWAADDGARVASLETRGTRLEGAHVVVWFPASLSRTDGEALVTRLDPAVDRLWRLVGEHDWQTVPKGRITYYLHDDTFVAHASGRGAVFVPMARVKDGRAPFLHEATHELLASKRAAPSGAVSAVRRPLWLTEGLPDYLTRLAADALGIVETGPFSTPSLDGVDGVCGQRARTADGGTMLPFIGTAARPEVLFTTDRARFAPTFYSCAFSFTKHLVARVGVETLVGLFALTPAEMAARLEHMGGRPLADVRADWLRAVVAPPR